MRKLKQKSKFKKQKKLTVEISKSFSEVGFSFDFVEVSLIQPFFS